MERLFRSRCGRRCCAFPQEAHVRMATSRGKSASLKHFVQLLRLVEPTRFRLSYPATALSQQAAHSADTPVASIASLPCLRARECQTRTGSLLRAQALSASFFRLSATWL